MYVLCLKDIGYYIVSDGSSPTHLIAHIEKAILEKKYKVDITNVTEEIGIISVQGRNRYNKKEKKKIQVILNVGLTYLLLHLKFLIRIEIIIYFSILFMKILSDCIFLYL